MKDFISPESCFSFPPLIHPNSRILILGTYPSLKSFEKGFYYAHPQNRFWPILGEIFGERASTVTEQKALLAKHRLALWDTCRTCIRKEGNSSDTNLTAIEPNDIAGLLERHPAIHLVCFTGKKAQAVYQKYFPHLPVATALLPSPSPANQTMGLEEKTALYKAVLFG
jgi:hypoxanthine-DNA glycosylase